MQPKAQLPKPEELLLDYARRLERHRKGRHAFWFHLSRLAPENRQDTDIQLAAHTLGALSRRAQGEMFVLENCDIVVCASDPDWTRVSVAADEICQRFERDPLMLRASIEGPVAFLTLYDIEASYEAFLSAIRKSGQASPAAPGAGDGPAAPDTSSGLGARLMLSKSELSHRRPAEMPGHIETSQGRIAIERLLEQRALMAAAPDGTLKPWGMRERVRPEAIDAFDLLAVALARKQITLPRATAEVERGLLATLAEHVRKSALDHHILALHCEALISPEFLVFDRIVSAAETAKPKIAFFVDDVGAEGETFAYLKSFLLERDYPIGFTGVTLKTAAAIAGPVTELSFVEVDHSGPVGKSEEVALKSLMLRLGPAKLIVSDLRTELALNAVLRAGVKLVSGPATEPAAEA